MSSYTSYYYDSRSTYATRSHYLGSSTSLSHLSMTQSTDYTLLVALKHSLFTIHKCLKASNSSLFYAFIKYELSTVKYIQFSFSVSSFPVNWKLAKDRLESSRSSCIILKFPTLQDLGKEWNTIWITIFPSQITHAF